MSEPGVARYTHKNLMQVHDAGPDGLELLAFSTHHEGDAEFIPGWRTN
jgi:hypothetical protein